MMQSRLAVAAVARSCVVNRYGRFLGQRMACGATATATGTSQNADPGAHSGDDGADPAVYPRDPEGMDDVANPKPAVERSETEVPRPSLEEEPLTMPPTTPRTTAQKLESNPVGKPADPNFQQKRQYSSASSATPPVGTVSCAGLDGTPWPEDDRAGTESDKEYYKHHKASPLSEIEFADTRKPITQATDGTASAGTGKDVIGWLPEQLDTAEEALKRAAMIFKRNAERGDPETFKHSRVLREMRGEWF